MNHTPTSVSLVTIVVLGVIGRCSALPTLQNSSVNSKTPVIKHGDEFGVNRFDRAGEVSGWKLVSGLPGSAISFDPTQEAGGSRSKGSMKLVLPFTEDGEFDFNFEKFSNGVDLKSKGFQSISLDVKVDPKSPAWGDFHAGWFELGITAGKEGKSFLKQYGENLDIRNGWFHLSVPITGDVSDTRGFGIKFFASGLTTGNRVVWIDNLVLSKAAVVLPKPNVAELPRPSALVSPKTGAEMLVNGDFSSGSSKWVLEESGSAKGKVDVVSEGPGGKPALRLTILAVEDHAWHIQVYQTGMVMEKGRKYAMTFWAKSAKPGVITAECNQNHEPWEHQTNVKLPVTTEWTQLRFDFVGPWDDDNLRISFTDLGTSVGQIYWFAGCSLKPLGGPQK